MTAAEARKKRWEELKGQPVSKRIKYIFTFYWPAILLGLFGIFFIVTWIPGFFQPDLALGGYLFDCLPAADYEGNLAEDFMGHQQLSTKDYEFRLTVANSADSLSNTNFGVKVGVGEVDFFVAGKEAFAIKAGCVQDLREVLTPEQLTQWKDWIVYIEKDSWDALHADTFETPVPELFMSTEGMTNPVPFAIRLPQDCKLLQAYKFAQGDILFGITTNGNHTANAVAFLEYILN